MATIDSMQVDLFRLPLPTPVEASAAGLMKAFDMVAVRLIDSDGVMGFGYTVLHEGQGASVAKVADLPFREILIGADPDRIEWLWQQMYKRHHYAGRGGPVAFAMAAIDVALWDMKGRRLNTPLWRLLGGHDPMVRAYAGNIDLNFPVDRLLDGASKSVEAGFHSVKMRLGRPTLAEDVGGASTLYSGILVGLGAGAITGTLAVSQIRGDRVRGMAFAASGVGSGLAMVLLGTAAGSAMVLVGGFLAGLTQASYMTMSAAWIQRIVTDDFRGRVMSFYIMIAAGHMAILNLGYGWTAERTEVRALLVGPGIVWIVVFGVAIGMLSGVRSLVRRGRFVSMDPLPTAV